MSGLGVLAATFSGCDPKAESPATGQNSQAVTIEPGSPVSALPPAHVKPSRATKHAWHINKTAAEPGAPSVRAAYIRSVQNEGGTQYAGRGNESGEVTFDSQDHKLAAQAGSSGFRVAAAAGKSSATFRLQSYGCTGESSVRFAGAAPMGHGNRVSYRHGDVVEWYQNGRLGVEQGFDLQKAPACRTGSSDGTVELKIALNHSLRAALTTEKDGAQSLLLRDEANDTVLHYSDLFAQDADGKTLPAKMALNESGTELTLRVDDRGARYPLHIDPLIWAQVNSEVKAGDPDSGDNFGYSISAAGDTAVVGAPLDDEGGTDAGAIYVFTMNSQGTWSQRVKVAGPSAGANYGWSVGITKLAGGDYRIVAGAPMESSGNGLANWYRGAGDNWLTEAEFSGAGAFGSSVGVSGNRVIIGAYGEASNDGVARIYEPDPRVTPIPWNETATITDVAGSGGQLGASVAIDGDIAVVGEPSFDVGATDDGRAFVLQHNPAGAWTRVAMLTASDRMANANFGFHVAVQGLTAIIGAPGHNANAGGAYVFSSIAGTWAQISRLHTLAGVTLAAGDKFGSGLSQGGSTVTVGAPSASSGAGIGYVFGQAAGVWSFKQTFTTKIGGTGLFGISMSQGVSGHILAGTPTHGSIASNSGAFYDIILRKQNGDACAAAVECASDFCVDGVCCNTACGAGITNDCQACSTAMGGTTNGTCTPATAATTCRAPAGACDVAELCDGSNTACPNDTFMANTVECRGASSTCDVAENCTGTSAACPADAVAAAQTTCRMAAGDCDVPELCDGQTKICPPNQLKPALSICRGILSECDYPEVCSGTDVNCPPDVFLPDAAPCGNGSCQAGVCRTEADLGISISGPPSVQPGQDLVFTVNVTNFGIADATNISVNIILPKNAPLLASSGAGAVCQSSDTGLSCTIASLKLQQGTNIALQLRAPTGADTISVDATVRSTVLDPNPGNDNAKLVQNLLSPRISGGGCSAVPGGPGASGFGALASLLGLFLVAARRRRGSN